MINMPLIDWGAEIPSALTLTDKNGIIIYMNKKSNDTFADDGGESLIGKKLTDCHNSASNKIINEIISSGKPNIYTIEKRGIKKLIYQTPYFKDGIYQGLAELSIVLPDDMPHFNRDIQ